MPAQARRKTVRKKRLAASRKAEPGAILVPLVVNGRRYEVAFPVHKTLLEVLREDMNLTGTKHGCELGECGTCTVLVDGKPILSCLALAVECQGKKS